MRLRQVSQFKISHLLWITLLVAVLCCGYLAMNNGQTETSEIQTFSFYISSGR